MRAILQATLLFGLFGVLAGTTPRVSCQEPGETTSEMRVIRTRSGDEIRCEIGTFYVSENRADPQSRTIAIGFARFPAESDKTTAPPVFRLPGGPGSSFVSRIRTATADQIDAAFPELMYLRGTCDVVFVDQRGFSDVGDKFRATFQMPPRSVDSPGSLEREVEAFKEFAKSVVDSYSENGVDLRGYQVKECAADVYELANSLGYSKVTLCGTSFGSQWSFAIMKLYPDFVERALLSGVEPLNHGYDMPSHAFAAMRRIWRHLENDRRFQPYLPEGGFEQAARELIERLEREPMEIFRQGDSGVKPERVGVLGPEDFPWHDPVQILELYHGKTDRMAFLFANLSAPSREVRLIGPLIDSSLGVTPERRHQLWTDPAIRYLGRDNFASYLGTADIWPSEDVGDDFRTPEVSDIPVVFCQGDWDFQTPIENTYEIASYFTNCRVLVAHRGGHGVLQPIARENQDAWEQLVEFLGAGDLEGIPSRVTLSPSRRFRAPAFEIDE